MANMSINDYKLMRARDGRMLAGVAAGLARASGLDVVIVRLCIAAMVLSGFGVPAYILMWIILPEESPRRGRVIEPAPEQTARIIRIAVVGLGVVSLFNRLGGFWGFANPHPNGIGFDGALGLILLGIGIAVLFSRHRPERGAWDAGPRPVADGGDDDPPPTFTGPLGDAMGAVHEAVSGAFSEMRTTMAESRPRRPQTAPTDAEYFEDEPEPEPEPRPVATVTGDGLTPSGGAALGWARVFGWLCLIWWTLAALVTTAAWAVGAVSVHSPIVLAVASWLVFTAVLNTLLHARFAKAIIPSLALLLIPIGIGVATVRVNGDIGHYRIHPASIGATYSREIAAGYLELDLSHTQFTKNAAAVHATVSAGRLDVTVPDNATVVVHTHTKSGGGHEIFEHYSNGFSPDYNRTFPGCEDGPKLTLDLKVGGGFIQVQRANGDAKASCPT